MSQHQWKKYLVTLTLGRLRLEFGVSNRQAIAALVFFYHTNHGFDSCEIRIWNAEKRAYVPSKDKLDTIHAATQATTYGTLRADTVSALIES
jgi:hypothetical protein